MYSAAPRSAAQSGLLANADARGVLGLRYRKFTHVHCLVVKWGPHRGNGTQNVWRKIARDVEAPSQIRDQCVDMLSRVLN